MACRMENPQREKRIIQGVKYTATPDVVTGQNWAKMMEKGLLHFSLWFENTEELLMQCKSEGLKGGKAEKETW